MDQLHVVTLNEVVRRKKALWRPAGRKELESLVVAPWASRRRQDLIDVLDQLTPKIQELTQLSPVLPLDALRGCSRSGQNT
jgi:transposase